MCFWHKKKEKESLIKKERNEETAVVYSITTVRDLISPDSSDMDEIIEALNLPLYDKNSIKEAKKTLRCFLSALRVDLKVVVERQYVDRMFRDSYYYMYSKKSFGNSRFCVRLSFLDCQEIQSDGLFLYRNASKFKEHYLGFLVLRPILKYIIGRNVISPKAMAERNFAICDVAVPSSVCGVSVSVTGFPHCSQDTETMSCAESTLWSIMEYYAHKSPLYKLLLPSDIHAILSTTSNTRLIPSHGLMFDQLSNVLCHCGFECVLYSKDSFDNETIVSFKEIFTCYVESGIPLAVCITTDKEDAHAVVCVGRKIIGRENVFNKNMTEKQDWWGYSQWNCCVNDFVFVDDNRSSYQKATFDMPLSYYKEKNKYGGDQDEEEEMEDWGNGTITHFIAPLPNKVYLDAKAAIAISNSVLHSVLGLSTGTCVRTFLVSCQDYRDFVIRESNWSDEDIIHFIGLKMPKYVWITEFSDYGTFEKGLANGILVLDSTGREDVSSILYYRTKEEVMFFDEHLHVLSSFEKSDGKPIKSYNRNLNNYI